MLCWLLSVLPSHMAPHLQTEGSAVNTSPCSSRTSGRLMPGGQLCNRGAICGCLCPLHAASCLPLWLHCCLRELPVQRAVCCAASCLFSIQLFIDLQLHPVQELLAMFKQLTSISGRLGPTVLLLVGSRYYNYPLIQNATTVEMKALPEEAAAKLLTNTASGKPEALCCFFQLSVATGCPAPRMSKRQTINKIHVCEVVYGQSVKPHKANDHNKTLALHLVSFMKADIHCPGAAISHAYPCTCSLNGSTWPSLSILVSIIVSDISNFRACMLACDFLRSTTGKSLAGGVHLLQHFCQHIQSCFRHCYFDAHSKPALHLRLS